MASSTRQRTPIFGRSLGRTVSTGSGDSGNATEQAAAAAAAVDGKATASTTSKGGMFGMAVGVWRKATSKLFDLEAKIANQVGTEGESLCSLKSIASLQHLKQAALQVLA